MWIRILLVVVIIVLLVILLSRQLHVYVEQMFIFNPAQRSSAEFKALVDALSALKAKLEEVGLTLDRSTIALPRILANFNIAEHVQDRFQASRDYDSLSAVMWSQRCPFSCDMVCDAVSEACSLCRKAQIAGVPPCNEICDILKGGCQLVRYTCKVI